MRFTIFLLLAACALCCVVGCSGGGNSGGSTPQRSGKATITIKWPTRAAVGRTFIPSDTQSVVIVLNNGNGFTVNQTINRTPTAATISYTFTGVPVGSIAVTVQAYDGQSGTGSLLASGTSVESVSDGQTTTVTAEMNSDVASVTINPYPTSVKAGQTTQLVATVLSTDNSTILEPADDVYWTSSDPTTATVDQTGLVTGVKSGTVTVTAQERESGVSGTVQLTIAQGNGSLVMVISSHITITVNPPSPKLVPSATQQFNANVSDVPNQTVLWSVQETGGGSITNAGLYTAPSTPGTYHVIATSIANPSITATATITVSTATSSSGVQIYVVDELNHRIIRMNDMTGAGWTTFGCSGHGDKQFFAPWGIAFGPDGKIYITDGGNSRIVRMDDFAGDGWTILGGGNQGSGVNQFCCPTGIAIGPDGKIYIADELNNRIVRVDDINGTGWTTLGTLGSGVNQFSAPDAIAFGPDGKIYVADQCNYRLVRMNDLTGAGWTTLGSRGNGPGQFGGLDSIAIGADGKIYVADGGNCYIECMNDMTGAGWTTLGRPGTGNMQFSIPNAITLGPDGKIYITDSCNNRIDSVSDMLGTNWTMLGGLSSGSGANQFYQPQGIVVR